MAIWLHTVKIHVDRFPQLLLTFNVFSLDLKPHLGGQNDTNPQNGGKLAKRIYALTKC